MDEKTAIEEQKSRLEEDVRHQTREFKRSKQVMDKQLQELALSIQQKEELIQELARNEAEAKHLTHQYETRMLELEAEVLLCSWPALQFKPRSLIYNFLRSYTSSVNGNVTVLKPQRCFSFCS